MSTAVYREVLAIPGVTRLLLFAVLARVPNAATSVVLTFWVVIHLGLGYGAAGLVATLLTAGVGIGSPWRGRRLDQLGLRRAIAPSIIVEGVCWALIPFIGYRLLLPTVFLAGLLAVPTFTVVRQAVTALTPEPLQPSAFMLDSISTEFTYMIAPAAGVVLATSWSVTGALVVVGCFTVLSGIALMIVNPALRSPDEADVVPAMDSPARIQGGDAPETPRTPETSKSQLPRWRQIYSRPMLLLILATGAALVVLGGTEVSVVAFLREKGHSQLSALVFIIWSLSSAVGGFLLGAEGKKLPVFWVLLGLGLLTIPVGFAPGEWWLVAAIIPTGFFCAPTISATATAVNALVNDDVRGEAMGWYGAAAPPLGCPSARRRPAWRSIWAALGPDLSWSARSARSSQSSGWYWYRGGLTDRALSPVRQVESLPPVASDPQPDQRNAQEPGSGPAPPP